MAVGTETIPKVDFITGPGNLFVAEALTVATDLLSQAEHGYDSPCVFITTSETLAHETIATIDKLPPNLVTSPIAGSFWKNFGEIAVVENVDQVYALADEYAHEHFQILTKKPREALEKMQHYGALFLGEKTCVPYGDKVIGINNILPTRKAARDTGGLRVGKFLRTVTCQQITSTEASGKLGLLCGRAARTENFKGHACSGDLCAAKYLNDEHVWIKQAQASSSNL
ncbi:ALDH-like protein [Aspergillus caelatus]|uniref:ALDH-like protein n=1 Tax=Aspergillus caelatus TaxID=61420 RepID=A0A5N7A693_9EURO|nr:ALDH-like protein [Aspergillus caelatus]KAE8364619.1 ALDH-like protein [Aspergillus caelatus]